MAVATTASRGSCDKASQYRSRDKLAIEAVLVDGNEALVEGTISGLAFVERLAEEVEAAALPMTPTYKYAGTSFAFLHHR